MASAKSIEKRILKYVITYGSTSETDLVYFIVRESGCSAKNVKSALDKMVAEGKIGQVKHCKLKPPKVYVDLRERALLRLEGELFANIVETAEKENVRDKATKIKEEAYAVAVTDDCRETNIDLEAKVKELEDKVWKVFVFLDGDAAWLTNKKSVGKAWPPIAGKKD